MADEGGKLFDKSFWYIFVKNEGFGSKIFRLIGTHVGTFTVKRFNYAPESCWVTHVGARFNNLGLFLSAGIQNVMVDSYV